MARAALARSFTPPPPWRGLSGRLGEVFHPPSPNPAPNDPGTNEAGIGLLVGLGQTLSDCRGEIMRQASTRSPSLPPSPSLPLSPFHSPALPLPHSHSLVTVRVSLRLPNRRTALGAGLPRRAQRAGDEVVPARRVAAAAAADTAAAGRRLGQPEDRRRRHGPPGAGGGEVGIGGGGGGVGRGECGSGAGWRRGLAD